MQLSDITAIAHGHLDSHISKQSQRVQTGVSEIFERDERPVTYREGADRLDVFARHAATDPIVKARLQRFRVNLKQYQGARPPSATIPDIDKASVETHEALNCARTLVYAHRTSEGGDRRLQMVGKQVERAELDRLRLDAETDALWVQRRQAALGTVAKPTEIVEQVREGLDGICRQALEPNASFEELRSSCDALYMLDHRFGRATAAHNGLFADEAEMRDGAACIFLKYGRHVMETLTRARAADLEQARSAISNAADPTMFASSVKLNTRVRRTRLDFERTPSLTNWQALTQATAAVVANAALVRDSRNLGEAAFTLETITRTFRRCMQRIKEDQDHGAAQILKAERALAALNVGESSTPQRTTKKSKSKQRSRSHDKSSAVVEAVLRETPSEEASATAPQIRAAVRESAASISDPRALEGAVAQLVIDNLSAFSEIVGFNQKFARSSGSLLGEIDLHLDNAIIECTLRSSGKEKQLTKYLNDPIMNPQKKAVVLYAEKYTGNVPTGVLVARSPIELGDILFAIKAKELGWLRP